MGKKRNIRNFIQRKSLFSEWYIISFGLATLLIFSPVGAGTIQLWLFCHSFCHEMGHVFFAFLAGDQFAIVFQSPFYIRSSIPSDTVFAVLFLLGGLIFTSLLTINLILYIYIFCRFKKWNQRIALNFGQDTICVHLVGTILLYFLFDFLSNGIPVELNEQKSDMALLLDKTFSIPFILSETSLYPLYFIFLLLLLIIHIIMVCSYFIFVSNLVYCLLLNLKEKKFFYKHQMILASGEPSLDVSLHVKQKKIGILILTLLTLLGISLLGVFPLDEVTYFSHFFFARRGALPEDNFIRFFFALSCLLSGYVVLMLINSWVTFRIWPAFPSHHPDVFFLPLTISYKKFGFKESIHGTLTLESISGEKIFKIRISFRKDNTRLQLPVLSCPLREKFTIKLKLDLQVKETLFKLEVPSLSSLQFYPTHFNLVVNFNSLLKGSD